uniref:Uncharacterized protein n=1 Tax=Rhizophora mucronata TaxID=61149 RepID=A0A2P2N5Q5_RHIMU
MIIIHRIVLRVELTKASINANAHLYYR